MHSYRSAHNTAPQPPTPQHLRAVLYVNKDPCGKGPNPCRYALGHMLPDGAQLAVYAPERKYIFQGRPDPQPGQP